MIGVLIGFLQKVVLAVIMSEYSLIILIETLAANTLSRKASSWRD